MATVLEELGDLGLRSGDPKGAHAAVVESLNVRKGMQIEAYERRRVAELGRLRRLRRTLEADDLRARIRDLTRAAARLAMENEAHLRETRQLAHDLRNPLTVLVGSLELIEADRHDLVSAMKIHAQRMRDLLERVLERPTPEEVHPESVDLPELLRTIADAYRPRARAKEIGLEVGASGVPAIWTDPSWVGRIVDNLVANAVKFSKPGGTISVAATCDGLELRLDVLDSGPGFAPDELTRVFDDGVVGVARPTGGEPSTGHGLFVVRCLAEALGGTVVAANRKHGGAQVSVCWPCTPPG